MRPIFFLVGPPVQGHADVGRVRRRHDLVLYYQFHILALDASSLRRRCGVARVRPVVVHGLVRVRAVEFQLCCD